MKKSTLFALICILCVGSAYAAGRKVIKVKQLRSQLSQVENVQVSPVLKFVPQNYKGVSGFAAAANSQIPLSEDFSGFAAGSESEPDGTEISDPYTGEIPADYTRQPGWMGAGVYQAGGVAYVGMFEGMYGLETGFMNTPSVDLSANSGTFTVNIRARSTSAEGDELAFLLLTYDAASGDYVTAKSTSFMITDEWASYAVPFNMGTDDSFIQFYAVNSEYYVDDFEVVMEGLPAPLNLHVTNYRETSATLNWDAVAEAESYLVNVYYFDSNNYEYVYLEQDTPVSTTSFEVSGLNASETYFFDVRSVKGDLVSPTSESAKIEPDAAGPDGLSCENYTGSSFTARWNAVDGATSYLLNVFSLLEDGWDVIYVPFLDDQEVSATSYEVTGLDEATVYYFSVKAKFADGTVSRSSAEIPVLPTVQAPVATAATEVTGNSFVANWSEVDFGQAYLPNVYKEHTAEQAESYSVANADFELIESTGTLEEPETTFQGTTLGAATGAYGWYISMPAFISGAVGLDNSWAALFGPSFMYSPEYDLSVSDGKATLKITVASADATGLIVSLAEVDADGYLQEIEGSGTSLPVTPVMTEHTVNLTNGTESCYVLVYATDGTYLLIDDLYMAVELKAGDKFEYLIDGNVTEGVTSCRFENIDAGKTDRISYDVSAVYVGDGSNVVYSDISNRVYVDLLLSVTPVTGADAEAYVENGSLFVLNPAGDTVEVFGASGVRLFQDVSGAARLQMDLPERGVYLVKIGDAVRKVVK